MSRHKILDDAVRQWIESVDDEALLAAWREVIERRINALRGGREMTREQVHEMLLACRRGDPLYAERRVRFGAGDLRATVYFYHYQPRKRRLWIAPTPSLARADLRAISLADAAFHQLGRTELEVRRRAARGPRRDGLYAGRAADSPVDDLPF